MTVIALLPGPKLGGNWQISEDKTETHQSNNLTLCMKVLMRKLFY